MTPEGEIRLQAFMLANGNYTVPCFAIPSFESIILPGLWSTFYSDYKKGRNTIPLSNWSIEKYRHRNLNELQTEIQNTKIVEKATWDIDKVTKFGSFTSIIAGGLGMTFCLPFLFSSNLADLVGAGFPFVGGAILVIGGLLVLSNISQSRISNTN